MRYHQSGRYDEAIERFNRALELSPDASRDTLRLTRAILFARAASHHNSGKFQKAVDDSSEGMSIAEFPDLPFLSFDRHKWLFVRANSLGELGEYDKAINDLSKAIEINPEYADAYFVRGFVYFNLGQTDAADKDLEKAIELDPSRRGETYE